MTATLTNSEPHFQPIGHNRLSLSTEWMTSAVVRITVTGEIDASNAPELADYIFRHAANSRRLVLDLQKVEFFGTAGFSTLMEVQARCTQAAVTWLLVPGRAVSRVLEICDPRGTLPIADS